MQREHSFRIIQCNEIEIALTIIFMVCASNYKHSYKKKIYIVLTCSIANLLNNNSCKAATVMEAGRDVKIVALLIYSHLH